MESFEPTPCELRILAAHYFDLVATSQFDAIYHDNIWRWRERLFNNEQRLQTIANLLGEENFEKAIKATQEKWDKKFAGTEAWLKAEEDCFRVWWRTLPDKSQARKRWNELLEEFGRHRNVGGPFLSLLGERVRDLREEGKVKEDDADPLRPLR